MNILKKDWLWDRKISISQARRVLKNPKDKRFILIVSLLLTRKLNPREIFKDYLDPLLFCQHWVQIKRKMRQDKWARDKIIFWQAIYERLLNRYQKRGEKFRKHKNVARDAL